MILLDVNLLVYAHKEGSPSHQAYREWLEALLRADQPFGIPSLVLSGFLRIVTHPRVFDQPSSIDAALTFVEQLRSATSCVTVRPAKRHFDIFQQLVETTRATGNLIPNAYLAALAIETGSEWVTTDRGFARFPKLRWRTPF